MVHRIWRCLFTRLALGELDLSLGDRMSLSAFEMSSSVNGSLATLSGLVQLPLSAEKPELPSEETDESENEEHTELARWNEGRCLVRLSLIRSHSWLGLSSLLSESVLAHGVVGVTRRGNEGSGESRPLFDAVVGLNVGLEDCDNDPDISIVGMTLSVSGSNMGPIGTSGRRLLIVYFCRGGGGGCVVDFCSSCSRSGVRGIDAVLGENSKVGGSEMENSGRGRDISAFVQSNKRLDANVVVSVVVGQRAAR